MIPLRIKISLEDAIFDDVGGITKFDLTNYSIDLVIRVFFTGPFTSPNFGEQFYYDKKTKILRLEKGRKVSKYGSLIVDCYSIQYERDLKIDELLNN